MLKQGIPEINKHPFGIVSGGAGAYFWECPTHSLGIMYPTCKITRYRRGEGLIATP